MSWLRAWIALSCLALASPARAQTPLLLENGASAAAPSVPSMTGFVTDPARRLSAAERAELERKLWEIHQELHTDLAVYLIDHAGSEPLEASAGRAFRAWKIGGTWDSGALLTVSPDNRAVLYMGDGGVEQPFSKLVAQVVLWDFGTALQQAGLGGAVGHTLDMFAMKVRELDGTKPRPPGLPDGRYKGHFGAAFAALLLALSVTTYRRMRRGQQAPAEASPGATHSLLLAGLARMTGWRLQGPAWLDLVLVIAVGVVLRTCWLSEPRDLSIFDEVYYLQDARVILGLPVKAHDLPRGALSFLDPNTEHPPLAKLIIALAMHLLGDNPWGQRIASVVFGTACIPLLYGLVRRLGGSHGVALLAAYFLALENLSFIHSRIATLDVFFVFFMLCGLYAYAAGKLELSAFALALSTVCKLSGLFGFVALLGFHVASVSLEYRATRRALLGPWKDLGWLLSWYAACTLILLGVLDSSWTRFPTPIAHLEHILDVGTHITRDVPQGPESVPWQWMMNEGQIAYAKTTAQVGDATKLTVWFRGALNPYLVFFAPVTLLYAGARGIRDRQPLALLSLALFFGTYAPYWLLWYASHRICYLYYFLPAVPALTIACALYVNEQSTRIARAGYVLAVALGTWAYFPFRELP